MSESVEGASYFKRHPVMATSYIWAGTAAPTVAVMVLVGAPLIVPVVTAVVMGMLAAYLAYRTIRHPDKPGLLIEFFQDAAGWFSDF